MNLRIYSCLFLFQQKTHAPRSLDRVKARVAACVFLQEYNALRWKDKEEAAICGSAAEA